MVNKRPGNKRPRAKTPHTLDPAWFASGDDGAPRPPALDGAVTTDNGELCFSIRLDPRSPRKILDTAMSQILTRVLWMHSRGTDRARDQRERLAVVAAWKAGHTLKRQRTRAYISGATGIPEYRVKIILRDYRRHLATTAGKIGKRRPGPPGSKTNPIRITRRSQAKANLSYILVKKARRLS